MAEDSSQRSRRFTDFLKSCLDATPYVTGLTILNDCIENQRLLQKLPDWCTNRWNRTVTEQMDQGANYPSFQKFVEFLQKEARVINNPICSLQSLKNSDPTHKPGGANTNKRDKRDKGTTLVMKTW